MQYWLHCISNVVYLNFVLMNSKQHMSVIQKCFKIKMQFKKKDCICNLANRYHVLLQLAEIWPQHKGMPGASMCLQLFLACFSLWFLFILLLVVILVPAFFSSSFLFTLNSLHFVLLLPRGSSLRARVSLCTSLQGSASPHRCGVALWAPCRVCFPCRCCGSTSPWLSRSTCGAGWPGGATAAPWGPSCTCSAATAAWWPRGSSRSSRSRLALWSATRNCTSAWRTRSCSCSERSMSRWELPGLREKRVKALVSFLSTVGVYRMHWIFICKGSVLFSDEEQW